MKYPFSPSVLDSLPEELAELIRALEMTLLKKICSRLKQAGQLNEVTIDAIRALRSHGIDMRDIEKAIREATGISQKKLDSLLDDVVERNQAYYSRVIDISHVTAPEILVGLEEIEAIKKQCQREFGNITRSMGFLVNNGRTMLPPSKAYQWALDSAELQIQSGAISYNQAIERAVKELANSGLKIVDYQSGHVDSVDVAARRAVMTGVNQLNSKYREQSMSFLETDLVETTAHLGARNIDGPMGWENHARWQGKIYRMKGKPRTSSGDYPYLEDACGYGDVTGILGANCRHSFWPFIENVMERTYTDEELEAMKPENRPKIVYDGVEYDDYSAQQQQRKLEREIRKTKRRKIAFESAGLKDDATAAGARLRALNQKYTEFSKAAGLPRQIERMRVEWPDDKSTAAAETLRTQRAAEAPVREAIKRGDYPLTINPEKQARHMFGTATPGRSVITIPQNELQEIINSGAGSGSIRFKKGTFEWKHQEIIDAGRIIGYTINKNGDIIEAKSLKIHYSKTGAHAVPFSGRWKK